MISTKELYIIGPDASTCEYDVSNMSGKVTLCFSDGLQLFNNNKIHPSYLTFLDPNTVIHFLDRINNGKYDSEWCTGLKINSNLIYNDFQGTDSFYESGFTTSRGKVWNRNIFGGQILPKFSNLFKNTISLPTMVLKNTYDGLYDSKFSGVSHIISHERGINTDKLSCFILPMVLSYFTQLEKIHCIGFGDFTRGRIIVNSVKGYAEYMKSFDLMKPKLIELLKYKNVNVTFENPNSYFNHLNWKSS